MKRREFIAGLGGAVALPLVARAQQSERVRRIGVLAPASGTDPEFQARMRAFRQAFQELGWTEGRNVRIDYRWADGDANNIRKYAAELVVLDADVIVALGGAVVAQLQLTTRSIPIVFTQVPDPVGAGFVSTLSRPGGNITGFTLFEFGISVKWLELLRDLAPKVKRVVVLRDPAIPAGLGQLGAMQGVAPGMDLELIAVDVREAKEIERSVPALANPANTGLIVLSSATAIFHRNIITTLAAQHRLPAVYPARYFVAGGGLISYGPDTIDPHRRAASYVDRILKGEKPADLPVQAPTKFELVINLKTAKGLGLTIPPTLLARADEVIE